MLGLENPLLRCLADMAGKLVLAVGGRPHPPRRTSDQGAECPHDMASGFSQQASQQIKSQVEAVLFMTTLRDHTASFLPYSVH